MRSAALLLSAHSSPAPSKLLHLSHASSGLAVLPYGAQQPPPVPSLSWRVLSLHTALQTWSAFPALMELVHSHWAGWWIYPAVENTTQASQSAAGKQVPVQLCKVLQRQMQPKHNTDSLPLSIIIQYLGKPIGSLLPLRKQLSPSPCGLSSDCSRRQPVTREKDYGRLRIWKGSTRPYSGHRSCVTAHGSLCKIQNLKVPLKTISSIVFMMALIILTHFWMNSQVYLIDGAGSGNKDTNKLCMCKLRA